MNEVKVTKARSWGGVWTYPQRLSSPWKCVGKIVGNLHFYSGDPAGTDLARWGDGCNASTGVQVTAGSGQQSHQRSSHS